MSAARRRRRQNARGKQTVPQSGSTSTSTPDPSFHVWDCERMFERECPMRWEKLDPSPNDDVRHCQACDQDVYRCRTPADFVTHGELGHCVAILDGLSTSPSLRLGRTSPEEVLREKELADQGVAWWEDVLLRQSTLSTEQVEAIRAARERFEQFAPHVSPEHLAILRLAVRDGGIPCRRCGFDIASDEFAVMIFLDTRQCMLCKGPIELEIPSE
jgi:hypothetical protein